MKITRYLIVNWRGDARLVTTTPTHRSLKPTERAFRINVDLPDVRPVPAGEVTITVPPWPDAALAVEMYEAVAEEEAPRDE